MKKNISDILLCIGGLIVCTAIVMWSIPGAILWLGGFIILLSYSMHKAGK